jgi:hypothetical protein
MVLNEKKYAIEALNTYKFNESITSTLFIIAKYVRQVECKNDEQILDVLDYFMRKIYMDYNKVSWLKLFQQAIKSSNKYPLFEIDYIPITRSELDVIESIDSEQEKRIMFSMLCYAKYYNIVIPDNNGWVNTDAKVIFKTAHVQKNVDDQYQMFFNLSKNGYINTSKNMNTLNKQILIIDDTSEVVLNITDFRDLGYEYLLHKGVNYIRCNSCGRLTKGNKNRTKKYCTSCGKYETMKTKVNICSDCGNEYLVLSKDNESDRCEECYMTYRRIYKAKKEKERREMLRGQRNQDLDTIKSQ